VRITNCFYDYTQTESHTDADAAKRPTPATVVGVTNNNLIKRVLYSAMESGDTVTLVTSAVV